MTFCQTLIDGTPDWDSCATDAKGLLPKLSNSTTCQMGVAYMIVITCMGWVCMWITVRRISIYRRHGMDMMGVMVGKPHIKWGADEAGVAANAQT